MFDSDEEGYIAGYIENGHFPLELDSRDSNRDDEEDHVVDQFDLDLPTSHRYLGRLDNVSGYAFYDNGEEVILPAIETRTLVFPGYTLPLVLNDEFEISTLQAYATRKNAFVLLTPGLSFNSKFPWGMIMEIYETHLRSNALHLKARSRQRCKLVKGHEITRLGGNLYEVKVKVFLEQEYKSPIYNTQLKSLKHCRKYTCDKYSGLSKLFPYRKYHLAQYPLPTFVYDRHELCFLVERLVKDLEKHYLHQYIPEDPVQLSYWFVQTFQLKHSERLKIMEMGNVVERLRLELKYLNMKRIICCAKCEAVIAHQRDIIPMSKDGVQSNYCNPNGTVFETVTFSDAWNFNLRGSPSSQFTWFPGYSWTIIDCRNCNNHLGWQFSATNLKPECFYGLENRGFKIGIDDDDLEDIDVCRPTEEA